MNYKLNYKRKIPGETTANVFFFNNATPLRNCKAFVDANGELLEVIIDGKGYTPSELPKIGVAAVDFYRQVTLYTGR